MAELMMTVDTALAEVPVCLSPLLDDTDFKTREESVAYNAGGLDLVWNFVTKDGAQTQTAVTPTTGGGDYDWTNQGNGIYTIAIPASSGASINNDTEGFGWFTGYATGIVPWRGPVIQFSPANVVGSLVDGTDLLDVQTNLATGAAAIATTAKAAPDGFVITTGSNETNDEDSTHEEDGTYHSLEDTAGTTDAYYVFSVGGNGIPVSVTWSGYAQSKKDSYSFFAWNWSTSAWEQVGSIDAENGIDEETETFELTNAHVGTGANLGDVRFRYYSTDGTKIATDRILCSYSVVATSVGYADGAIWVDTNASNTNTEAYVDGVADNPVSTWAAALTLSSTLNIDRFRIAGGSSITLTGDTTGYNIIGNGLFDLAFGSQTVTDAFFIRASITGTGNGSSPIFEDCQINAGCSIPPGYYARCAFAGTSGSPVTPSGAGEFLLTGCMSIVAGSGTPYFDFSGTGSATGINVRAWTGGSNYTLDSDCTVSHEVLVGGGQTFTTGGADVELRGVCRSVTLTLSNAGTVQFVGITGPITISGTATSMVNLYGTAGTVTDTSSGTTVTNATLDASVDDIGSRIPAALVSGRMDAYVGDIDEDLEVEIAGLVVAALRSAGDVPGGIFGRHRER